MDKKPVTNDNQPIALILQWLTYAFWGLLIIALSSLITSILSHFLFENTSNFEVIYSLAASIIFLPLALVSELFYQKHEPERKTGAASFLQVIHAVIFAIIAIIALIVALFSSLQLLTLAEIEDQQTVSIYGSLISAVLFILLFVRIVAPFATKWLRRLYWIFTVVAAVIVIAISFLGPVAGIIETRQDRLIDSALPDMQSAINNYVATQNKLPDSLDDIELTGDAQSAFEQKLVEYKPNSAEPTTQPLDGSSDRTLADNTTHYYQLCATYKQKSEYYDTYAPKTPMYESSPSGVQHSYYIDTYNHPKGYHCYSLSTNSIYTSM
jgi:hypothetical protein